MAIKKILVKLILWFLLLSLKFRFISLKTGLKTWIMYHSGHGWNSTNYSCLEWLFPLEWEFSTLAVHRIIVKIREHLKDTDVPHGSLINKNLVGWGGDGQGSCLFVSQVTLSYRQVWEPLHYNFTLRRLSKAFLCLR